MTRYYDIWRTEPNGVLSAEVDGFRLVVQAPEVLSGSVRFMVLRREGEEYALLGSGTEPDVRSAMKMVTQIVEGLIDRPVRVANGT